MADFRALRHAALFASVLAVGCGGNPKPQAANPAPAAQRSQAAAVTQPPAPLIDPIAALITTSNRHYEAGERELAQGHLDKARIEFDRALDVLLESPYGARSDTRLREHFDRLVDKISAREVTALVAGDGFAEKPSEPASIDELLAVATFAEPIAPTPATSAALSADLKANTHDVPIPPDNEKVLTYIELFQGRLRDFLESGLARGAQYLPMIQNVFRAEGLPLDLAYVPLVESAFKPSALSRVKAKGMWQFMHGTALENGLKHDWYIDERADPEKATRAAAKYLKTLNKMFAGDWHLALASYNGGPGRVQRAMKRSGIEDFWNLTSTSRHLPRETREYVPMILAAIVIAKNPTQYGFAETTASAPATFEKVPLPRAMDLRRVAEWTGTSIDDIQALNPELRRWTTPVRDTGYEVKVPIGTAEKLRDRLATAKPGELAPLNWYRVKSGESIVTIARKLKVSRTDLAEANALTLKSRVRAGQELIIPRAPTTLLSARVDRPAPESTTASAATAGDASDNAGAESSPAKRTNVAAAAADPNGEESRVVYRVKRGDTLFSIARAFDTTIDLIKSLNNLRGNHLAVGDRLTIQTTRSARATQ